MIVWLKGVNKGAVVGRGKGIPEENGGIKVPADRVGRGRQVGNVADSAVATILLGTLPSLDEVELAWLGPAAAGSSVSPALFILARR